MTAPEELAPPFRREDGRRLVFSHELPEDVIVVADAPAGTPCHALTCQQRDVTALVVIRFGRLPGLWTGVWGAAYAMCAPCWDRTRSFVQNCRPALVVRRGDGDSWA